MLLTKTLSHVGIVAAYVSSPAESLCVFARLGGEQEKRRKTGKNSFIIIIINYFLESWSPKTNRATLLRLVDEWEEIKYVSTGT